MASELFVYPHFLQHWNLRVHMFMLNPTILEHIFYTIIHHNPDLSTMTDDWVKGVDGVDHLKVFLLKCDGSTFPSSLINFNIWVKLNIPQAFQTLRQQECEGTMLHALCFWWYQSLWSNDFALLCQWLWVWKTPLWCWRTIRQPQTAGYIDKETKGC